MRSIRLPWLRLRPPDLAEAMPRQWPADFFLVRDNVALLNDGPFPHARLVARLLAERDGRRGVARGLPRPIGFR